MKNKKPKKIRLTPVNRQSASMFVILTKEEVEASRCKAYHYIL